MKIQNFVQIVFLFYSKGNCTNKLKSNFINKKNMKLSLKLKVEVGKNIHIG